MTDEPRAKCPGCGLEFTIGADSAPIVIPAMDTADDTDDDTNAGDPAPAGNDHQQPPKRRRYFK